MGRSGWGKTQGKKLKEKGISRKDRKLRKNEEHLTPRQRRKREERLSFGYRDRK